MIDIKKKRALCRTLCKVEVRINSKGHVRSSEHQALVQRVGSCGTAIITIVVQSILSSLHSKAGGPLHLFMTQCHALGEEEPQKSQQLLRARNVPSPHLQIPSFSQPLVVTPNHFRTSLLLTLSALFPRLLVSLSFNSTLKAPRKPSLLRLLPAVLRVLLLIILDSTLLGCLSILGVCFVPCAPQTPSWTHYLS